MRETSLTFWDHFLPKIVTVLREGYSLRDLRADALAGLTVAIVALPLSTAIAIASGVGPERGLYTAIVGGFLVSALGGSRYQIGGPAGAFIVLVAACVMQTGIEGLILATFLSGFLLVAVGTLKLGSYIRFIPYPVTVGFTAGIAVIIAASQMKELLGLTLAGPEPSEVVAKVGALWSARDTLTPAAVAVAAGTIAMIETLKRLAPRLPNLLLAVVIAGLTVQFAGLPVETIGTRFGELPRVLPMPSLPSLSSEAILAALPFAISFTLLGAIESLLSAVVADGMAGTQHRPNAELIAQGWANVGSALFGGFCVTGTIARTATNVRAGSRGPVSGMLHALFVLGFMLVAAPLAAYIPLASLAGVLAVVAWNMFEKEEFWNLLRTSRGDAMVVLVTFLLVVFRDLTEGIVVGFALGGLVFIRRMSETATAEPAAIPEAGDAVTADRVVYRLRGPYFFGAAAMLGSALDRFAERPRTFVLDFAEVPFIDSSGARSFELLARKMARRGGHLFITGANVEVRRVLLAQGLREPHVRYLPDVASVDEVLAAGS
ncbi:SulP family sulfate permease [Cereibacter ovatus]|uniref:SulP family sulfate permease n=1 Tax=Cereibacter ovatus TaxID=439529 RepID=A0A285CPA3_9RHOB|nr:SulP family inorganic anion transporter [Cereibacter ovatus]SNX69245.1 SulP family sulfate permease [Cereibacter ovatus]